MKKAMAEKAEKQLSEATQNKSVADEAKTQ